MKTREQIITDMCYTMRHDYGIDRVISDGMFTDLISSGMTDNERELLWNEMAQIFDNCISPHMIFKIQDSRYMCDND
jgi:hypothetical protein